MMNPAAVIRMNVLCKSFGCKMLFVGDRIVEMVYKRCVNRL